MQAAGAVHELQLTMAQSEDRGCFAFIKLEAPSMKTDSTSSTTTLSPKNFSDLLSRWQRLLTFCLQTRLNQAADGFSLSLQAEAKPVVFNLLSQLGRKRYHLTLRVDARSCHARTLTGAVRRCTT